MALVSVAAGGALFEREGRGLRIDLDPSREPLLPSDDPGFAGYRQAVLDFGDDEIFVVAMQAEDVFRFEELSSLRRLTRAIVKLPGVQSVRSLVNVTVIQNDVQRDWIEVRRLVDEIPEDPAALLALRSRALADPLLSRSIVSRDGRTAAIDVRFRDWSDVDLIRAGVIPKIEALLEDEAGPSRRFYVAGRPYLKASAHSIMVSDLQRLMPLVILAMALVLWIVSGSLRGVMIPLGTVLIATLWTFALMALLGPPPLARDWTAPSSASPAPWRRTPGG